MFNDRFPSTFISGRVDLIGQDVGQQSDLSLTDKDGRLIDYSYSTHLAFGKDKTTP